VADAIGEGLYLGEYHVFAGFHRDWNFSHLKNQNTTGLNCSALSPQIGMSAPVNDVLVKKKRPPVIKMGPPNRISLVLVTSHVIEQSL